MDAPPLGKHVSVTDHIIVFLQEQIRCEIDKFETKS